MGDNKFRQNGFCDGNITSIYVTNAVCNRANMKILTNLNNPVLRIRACNSGEVINMNTSYMAGLANEVYLCVGSKVLLTSNVCHQYGLSNGTVCLVKDFVFKNEDVTTVHGKLPAIIWLSVLNNSYVGESFFPNYTSLSDWIPLHPTQSRHIGYKDGVRVVSTRTMFPIKLCYSWTAWKSQVQTITGKVVCHLGDQEKEDGLAYVIFSRVRRLDPMGIDGGLTLERLTSKINKRKTFRCRVKFEEEILNPKSERTKNKYNEIFGEVTVGAYSDVIS